MAFLYNMNFTVVANSRTAKQYHKAAEVIHFAA
jgi:hypothetical protein